MCNKIVLRRLRLLPMHQVSTNAHEDYKGAMHNLYLLYVKKKGPLYNIYTLHSKYSNEDKTIKVTTLRN
jgi:hypothetical protein